MSTVPDHAQQLPLSFAWGDEQQPTPSMTADPDQPALAKRRRGGQPGVAHHCRICRRAGHTGQWHEHWEKAIALYAEGVPVAAIMAQLGVNRTTIFRWVGKSDVPGRNARPLVRIGAAGQPEKYCSKCAEWLPFTEFTAHPKGHQGVNPCCRACEQERSAAYTETHRERQRARNKKYHDELRTRILAHYGNGHPCCACCGEATPAFLAVDHIEGGGNQHRRILAQKGMGNGGFYKWLEKNGYPTGYRLLCHNCNFARAVYGECPHMRKHSPELTDSLGTSD